MMPMHDKGASMAAAFSRRRLRRLIKASFFGVTRELFGCLIGPRRLESLPRRSAGLGLRMYRRGVSGDRFPRISALNHALRNSVKIEVLWTFQGIQFFPLKRSGNRCAGQSADTVGGDDRLRLPIAVDIQ